MSAIKIYDNFSNCGIKNRKVTQGVEFEMVQEFIDYREEKFKEKDDNKLAIFIETKINNNYPDIMFVEFNPNVYTAWTKKRNDLNINDLKILNYIIKHKNITSQKIVKQLSLNYKNLLFSLEKLFDANLIERKNQTWVKTNSQFIGVKKIEAVEAKINKWDTVVQQALLNKSFASQSSILYKRKSTPCEEVIEKVQSFGLGIYLYNDNSFSKCISPKTKKFPCDYNSLYINELIGKLLYSDEVYI
mgnify:FL=1